MRSRSAARPRCPGAARGGSTHTCWSCTASGVQADASALKRIAPSSTQSHERPSLDLRPRPPAEAVRVARERIDAELLLVRAPRTPGTSRSRSASVAARRPVSPGSAASSST